MKVTYTYPEGREKGQVVTGEVLEERKHGLLVTTPWRAKPRVFIRHKFVKSLDKPGQS